MIEIKGCHSRMKLAGLPADRQESSHLLTTVSLVVLLLISCGVLAAPARFGGYDLAAVAGTVADVLVQKDVIAEKDAKDMKDALARTSSNDPLVAGVPIVEFYSALGASLIVKNFATSTDIANAETLAKASGGLQVAGMNPAVLTAAYLDLFVRKGFLSAASAQSILDNARK